MAAKSPSPSNTVDRISSQQGKKAPAASPQLGANKADVLNVLADDQQWLEQSQQAWAERRAKEQELARAEKSGDRVLQLLEGEQVGEVTGQSLVMAQATPGEGDRKAVAAKADNDGKKAAVVGDDDGGLMWPLLGLGLLGAAAGASGGGSSAPASAPAPVVQPASELLVYSTEDEDGDRAESGEVDSNTDAGPYSLVRVAAYESFDTALLNDGSDDPLSLHVNFADRNDLKLEVLADGEDSEACADISTDDSFKGEILVSAEGDNAYADLFLLAETSGEASHSFDLTVEAVGTSSVNLVLVDLIGDDGIAATVDVTATASGVDSHISLDLWVSADSGASALEGNVSLEASGTESSVYAYVDSLSDSGAASYNGSLTVIASGKWGGPKIVDSDEWGGAMADIVVSAYDGDADFSGDVSVDSSASNEADVDISVAAANGDAQFSGDVTVTASNESADSEIDIDVYAEDGDANFDGNVTVTAQKGADGASADAWIAVSVDPSVDGAGEAKFSGDLTAKTERGSVYSTANVEILIDGGDEGYAHYSGDVLVSADGVSTDACADLELEASDVDMEGHLQVVASARDSCAEVDVSITADDAWIFGSCTEVDDSDDTDGVVGSTENDVAAEWSVLAKAQDASAYLHASIKADDMISAELNVMVMASATSAEADAEIFMSAYDNIYLMGDESNSFTLASDEDGISMGEDFAVEAAQFSSVVHANGASSNLTLIMDASSVDAQVNFLVEAVGRNADASMDVSVSADNSVSLGGGFSSAVSMGEDMTSDPVGGTENASLAFSVGEDMQAADWVVSASGDSAMADFELYVDDGSDTLFDVQLSANIAVQATDGASADAYVELSSDSDELNKVTIGGDASSSFSLEFTRYNSADQDNVVGEDATVTFASSEAALEWTAAADDGADAELTVYISPDGQVDMLFNLGATAGANAYSYAEVIVDAGHRVDMAGSVSVNGTFYASSSESDLYTENTIGEDATLVLEAAEWSAVANGDSGEAELVVDIDVISDVAVSEDGDVQVSANLLAEASATDSTSDINVSIGTDELLTINGGVSVTYAAANSSPSDDVSVDMWTEVSTEHAAEWTVTASGVDSYAEISVDVIADFIELRANQTITASGSSSKADASISLYADEDIHVSGEVTRYGMSEDFIEGDDPASSADDYWDIQYSSSDTQNATWTVTAVGNGAAAEIDFDANAGNDISLDLDVNVTAEGANSVASVDIYVYASDDVAMGEMNGANITVTATGSNSLAYTEVDLIADENVTYDGDITVLANGASGLDSDAVMDINLVAENEDAEFDGVVRVSALGADNDATLVIGVSGDDEAWMSGDMYVTAVGGVASVSVSVDGEFDMMVSLDADEGGHVFMSIVAETVTDSGIYVNTDNDGVVTLSMDVDTYDASVDIDVYGGVGGVFNLVLQDGFDLSVDLDDDVQGYGGQFNLTVETPLNFTYSSVVDSFYSIKINGFDTAGSVIDTLDFKGADFDGFYVDATTFNGTVTDAFSNVYSDIGASDDFDLFLADAETALDGNVDYFFGTNGTDGWLAVDGDGEGVDYVVELLGVTTFDWDALLSTQGQYVYDSIPT